jgi:uncharacterized RDD family membrane protein YckC
VAATQESRPASFWQRSVAWSIDTALIAPVAWVLAGPWMEAPTRAFGIRAQALLDATGQTLGEGVVNGAPSLLDASTLAESIAATHSAFWALVWPLLFAYAVLGAVYHVACECSSWQGSVGKRLLGLHVSDGRGRPLTLGPASARYIAAGLSWATLNLGHLMAAMPPTHRALHDRLSGTRVTASADGLPGWAWAWLAAVSLAGLVAVVGLTREATAIMGAALESALY